MEEKIEALKKKFEAAGIEFKEKIPTEPELMPRVVFDILAGRDKQECILHYRDKSLTEALNCDFEKFRFINGYEGIWSKDLKTIEAEVNSLDVSDRLFFEKLNDFINKPGESEDDGEEEENITRIDLPGIDSLKISIGYCSKEFAFLVNSRDRTLSILKRQRKLTLKIVDTKVTTHDNAKETLEKLANSIFFQIDLAFELPISLQSKKENFLERRKKRLRRKMFIDSSATISEPKYEYDSEPISLYWYAKESFNMPIFQYLAFYQTIEFYFPIFSSYETKQKIQSLIKDPRFNPNKDSDITKIISTIRVSNNGKSFGTERDQLRATIAACIDNNELVNFFKADESRLSFYSENKGKKLSNKKISVKNESADLITEVTDRIYEIRCRIVHSKASEGAFDVLLPYSNEVNELNFDIELIEFLSRKILIASSRPIKI